MFKLPEEIIAGIKDYQAALEDFIQGKISAARFTGVRVPWGIYSHRGGKTFMSRIRIPAGVVTPSQLKAISFVAKKYGSGIAHITTRQDIQVHGLKIEDTIKVIEYLKDYNLSCRGGGGNTVRNITSCALSGICKDECFSVTEYAIALSEYLLKQETSYNLPRKFKISFSGCRQDCSGCLLSDVGFLAKTQGDKKGFGVFVGAGLGRDCRLGKLLEDFLPADDLGYCTEAIKNIFYRHGNRRDKHHNRLRFLIEGMGFTEFKQLYAKEFQELKIRKHIILKEIVSDNREQVAAEIPKNADKDYNQFLEYNVRPQKQKGFSIVQLRISQGDLDAEILLKIAELEKDFSGIEFRTTQNQNLFICYVKNSALYSLFLKLKTILSNFLYPETLLDVVVCKGALTCNLGLCNSPALAYAIEEMLSKYFIGSEVSKRLDIKLNGCPNSCGQAPIGKLAFYGVVKRVDNRPVPFYQFLIGGRREAELTKLAEEIGDIPAKNIPAFLKELLTQFEPGIKDKDTYAFLEKEAKGIARRVLEKFSSVPAYAENRDFYIDWGKDEEFSLAGLGPGECGAGVLNMIESDLTEAKIALDEAQRHDYPAALIRKVLFLSSRALLVVKGIDPKSEIEAFSAFKEKFIQEGIATETYAGLKESFDVTADTLTLEARKEKFIYAKEFLAQINELYASMDSAFNFPRIKDKEIPKEKMINVLDLKGTPCPINYVKIKLFLENLSPKDIVEVFLDEGEPMDNVPKSLENDGHRIIKIEKQDGFYRLLIEKGS